MSNQMSTEDMRSLQEIADLDPEFVTQYLSTLDGKASENEQMPQKIDSKFYSVKEVGDMLSVCQNTVLGLIKKGKIKAIQESGGSRKWLISESHFNDYLKSTGIKAQSKPEKGGNMDGVYERATSKNVVDFLTTWEKRDVPFTAQTLMRDFSELSKEPVTEMQINNILASLARAGVVDRVKRGIYRYAASASVVKTEPKPAVPVIQVENHTDQFKKPARLAVEDFLARHASDDEDFQFSIDDVAKEYPKIDRAEIGKAIQNLHGWGKNSPNPNGLKIERTNIIGTYVRPSKNKPANNKELSNALGGLSKEELIAVIVKAIK